jgi:hypothetical protein
MPQAEVPFGKPAHTWHTYSAETVKKSPFSSESQSVYRFDLAARSALKKDAIPQSEFVRVWSL